MAQSLKVRCAVGASCEEVWVFEFKGTGLKGLAGLISDLAFRIETLDLWEGSEMEDDDSHL
jgi:hypothetical protein